MNDLNFKAQHSIIKIQNLKKIILNNNKNKRELFNIRNETELNNIKLNKILFNNKNNHKNSNLKIIFGKKYNGQNKILKVKKVNFYDYGQIYCELLAYKLLKNNKNIHICKNYRNIICSMDNDYFNKLNNKHLILCKKGKSDIPIVIFILEYVKGVSLYQEIIENKNYTKKLFIDFLKQLFLILYTLYACGIHYNDKNMNNFILVKKENMQLTFNINDKIIHYNIDYFIKVIDMDNVYFTRDDADELTIIGYIINKRNIFYQIIECNKSIYKNIINFEKLYDEIYSNMSIINIESMFNLFDNI